MTNERYFTVPGSEHKYDRNLLLAVLLIPLMMILLQVTSVDNLLPSMENGLGASEAQLQLVLSGYALATGITLVPAGRVGDVIGRSGMFVLGLFFFALGSFLCALAPSAGVLNVMRLIQGFGAGCASPQITGLIQQYFHGHARAKAFGYMGLVISMSAAAGPILSGLFVQTLGEQAGWRWSFAVNVPIGIIGIICSFYALPFGKERRKIGPNAKQVDQEYIQEEIAKGHKPPVKRGSKLDLDPMGMTMLAVAVMCIMLPFMTHFTWRWVLLAAGIVLSGLWVLWEKKYEERGKIPMVNLSLFKYTTFSFSLGISAMQFLGTTTIFAILAMFLQSGIHVSALEVGLVGAPNAVFSAIAAIWAGNHAMEMGRKIQVIALSLILLGIGLLTLTAWFVAHGAPVLLLSLPLMLQGWGFGCMGAANQTTAMLEIPAAHGGTAGGFYQTVQRVMTAIGNALITAVYFAVLAAHSSGNTTDHTPEVNPQGWFSAFASGMAVVAIVVICAWVIAFIFFKRPLPADIDSDAQA